MRTIRKFLLLFSLLLIVYTKFQIPVYADENLDEISNFEITVNVREDGTLDIRYDITWHVLSDKNGKEPVTWAKIGIPNEHCEDINVITSNIKSAKYNSDGGGGDFVRVDFNKKYYKGETFDFSFTIHQSYMYRLENEKINYSFTAGWFEDIEVKKITINWNRNWVEESTATEISPDGKYLVWTGTNLSEGEHFSTSVRYPQSTFATDEAKQFQEKSKVNIKIVILIAVVFFILLIALAVWLDDSYGGGSGFGGGYHSTYVSSCVRSSCACVSSCACACACAGGGRAGCSTKDFYDGRINKDMNNGISVTLIEKVIEEDLKK